MNQQTSAKYRPATLHTVDLSDHAVISRNPVQTRPLRLDSSAAPNATLVVKVDCVIHPHLSGIGGAFNEIGAEAFMTLPESERNRLCEALFNPAHGCGLTLCRTSIGASDFGFDAYSYSETAEDFEMKHFSVSRDEKTVLPFLRYARDENAGLRIFASPWSPPGWMKESGRMDDGDRCRDANKLKSDARIYNAYALYLAKYVQSYAEQGVEIERLIVQNETDMNPAYPGCDMHPDQMAELVFDYIQPTFRRLNVNCEVWAGSFRAVHEEHARRDAEAFMKLPRAGGIDGVALQYCQPDTVRTLRATYPQVPLMHSEGTCSDGSNSMEVARTRLFEVAMWLNNGTENFCYWNMILNETQSSAWGWRQNSLVTIHRVTGEIRYNPDYAPVCLLSRFIRPGDQCLEVASTEGLPTIAVRNDEGITVLFQNDSDEPVTTRVLLGDETHTVELPKQSLCALGFQEHQTRKS